MKALLFLVIILFSFSSCKENNVSPIEDGLKLKLKKLDFSINERIIVNLVNQNDSFFYMAHCNYKVKPDIEKKEDNVWSNYFSPVCLGIYPSGIMKFESGKEIEDTLVINESGKFRLKFSYDYTANFNLDKSIYSEEFTVK